MAEKKLPPPAYNLSSAPDPTVLKALLNQAKDLSPQQKIDMVFQGIEDQGYKLPPTVKSVSRSSIVPKEPFVSESGALSSLDIEGVRHNRSSGDFATRSATLRISKGNDSKEKMHSLSSKSLSKKASSKDMRLDKEEKKEKKEKKDKKEKKAKSSASSVDNSAHTSRTTSSSNLAGSMSEAHDKEVKKKESEKELFAKEHDKQKEKELEQQKLEKERAKEKEREKELKRQEREKEKQSIAANFTKQSVAPQKPKEKEREPAKSIKKVIDPAKKEKYNNKREWDALKSTDLERLNSSFKTENVEDPKLLFAPKPNFNFDNFRFVHQIAKLGGVTVPEIVLVGKQGVGKSELLEALIGRPINYVGFNKNGQSKRPLFFHIVSSSESENPTCLIQSQSDKKSVPIEMTALLLEIENLNKSHKSYHPEKINVHYEYKHTFNFTVIDTPGLPYDSESDEYSQVEQHIEELLRPTHRLIVLVEEADQEEWDDVDNLRQLVKKFDPQNRRTVCVMNKFRTAVDTFTSPAQLSHYLTRFESSQTHFFTTLPTSQERHAVPSQKSFLQLLDQIESRDRRSTQLLGCSAKYDKYIGIKNLRKYIVDWCWKSYHQREVPKLFKLLESRGRKTNEELEKAKKIKNALNLRLLASRYATLYIHTAQGVLEGTSRGNPYVNGETRKEELDDQYFVSKEWEVPDSIPFENTRLYGGQQIERVFSEFKAILVNLKVDDRDADLLPDPEDKKYLFTACELVEKQIELLMMPLVEQLVQRATFVMSRVPIVVDNVLGAKGSLAKEADKLMIDAHYFSPFSSFLKDEFITHVDQLSDQCKTVCMEEFYSAKTIHYDIQLLDIQKEELSDREGLLRFIFDRIRQRILKNCIRKIYNIFLMPFMRADVWNALQTRIAVLEERELEEIFDADTINEGLQGDIDQLERSLEEVQQQEAKLHEIAPKF